MDQNEDAEVRVLPKQFYVNQEGGAIWNLGLTEAGTSSQTSTFMDPVSRANCYSKFCGAYPEQKESPKNCVVSAKILLPPIVLFDEKSFPWKIFWRYCLFPGGKFHADRMFKTAKTAVSIGDDGHALLCSGATSLEPINCYKHLKDNGAINLPEMLELKVCARAFDIARRVSAQT